MLAKATMSYACNKDHAYLSIVITVLPFWTLLTALIVFLILSFHRFSRSNKIYDNCNKNSARYAYYIELRTGDTSISYNKRRSTLFVDMFDESQTVLAKVAIPSHIVFGRKDSPAPVIEDEKYPELRVARFWLYRQYKLKKVSTVRFTHSCVDQDAKIMIYGMEIRSNEPDKHKLFFPVMNYITAFGAASRQNACFDLEPNGSVGAMGGSLADVSPISEQLTTVDYILLLYVLASLLFCLTSQDTLVADSFANLGAAAIKGAIVGVIAFSIAFALAMLLRFFFKHLYSLYIATGVTANLYYGYGGFILIVSTGVWIYTTVHSYANLCSEFYNFWLLSMTVAASECLFLIMLTFLISFIINSPSRSNEQYLNEDNMNREDSKTNSSKPKLAHSNNMIPPLSPNTMHQHSPMHPPGNWPMQHVPYMMPPMPSYQPAPNVYGQPMMMGNVAQSPASYKTTSFNYTSPHTHYNTPGTVSNTVNSPGYNGNSPPVRPAKKVGSSESTGSSYYQQLMKNKGGVKSISQYGELIRQKKLPKVNQK